MSVCRYYLQGNCRFGDRCRFSHVDDTPVYSNRRNDYGYGEEYHQQYNYKDSYGSQRYSSNDRYSQQQSQNQKYRYDSYQQQSQNQKYRYDSHQQQSQNQKYRYDSHQQQSQNQNYRYDSNQQQYQNNKNSYAHFGNKFQGYSEYEKYPSVLNQHQNTSQKNRNEWTSDNYESNFEHRAPRGSHSTYHTSTPKSKVAFSFKDPGPVPKNDQPSDLYMNQNNILYADVMKKDVAEWELGNMWLFSSYSPVTDKPCYPGFFDLSPEELRLEAYKAKESNTYNAYIESTEKAILEVKRKRDELKEPSVKLMSTIEKYRNGEIFDSEYKTDASNFFSTSSSTGALEEMIADDPQVPQQSIASSFSFKTTLETDSAVKTSASSFSFKLPSESESKQTIPHGLSDIYTPLEELELQDKEQFLASTFSLGKIPTVPPPKTMCF